MFRLIILGIVLAGVYAAPASPSVAGGGPSDVPVPSSITIPSNSASPSGSGIAPGPTSTSVAGSSAVTRSSASGKALSTIAEIRTPASTTKLAQLVAPLASPIAVPILSPVQVSPYAYAVPALGPIEIAPAPSTYSIEQHGYRIIY